MKLSIIGTTSRCPATSGGSRTRRTCPRSFPHHGSASKNPGAGGRPAPGSSPHQASRRAGEPRGQAAVEHLHAVEDVQAIIADVVGAVIVRDDADADALVVSALPPKADLPILELVPPPALGERRHRGLARRSIAVHRRAVLVAVSAHP